MKYGCFFYAIAFVCLLSPPDISSELYSIVQICSTFQKKGHYNFDYGPTGGGGGGEREKPVLPSKVLGLSFGTSCSLFSSTLLIPLPMCLIRLLALN